MAKAVDFSADLPWDEESEIGCLAAIMVSRGQLNLVRETVSSDDFFSEPNQILFDEIFDLWHTQNKCDPSLLLPHLRQKEKLEKAGGIEHLKRVIEQVLPTGPHGLFWAEKVREWSIERKMQTSLYEALRASQSREVSVQERLAQTISDLYSAQSRKMETEFSPASKLMEGFEARLGETAEERSRRICPTGFVDLDNILGGGFRRGQLVIIAARPGVGKTSLALNVASYAANAGPLVIFYSLEMHQDEIADRLVSSESGVESRKLRSGYLGKDHDRVMLAHAKISKLPLSLVTGGAFSPEHIALQVRAQIASSRVRVGMILIDYLQLVSPSASQLKRRESRERDVASISREFKRLSLDLDIPVVCACQLNRGATGEKPRLHHLRESGAIEQDADVVIFLNKIEGSEEEHDKYELLVVKQRNGPIGGVSLQWDKHTTTFRTSSLRGEPDVNVEQEWGF